MDNIITIIHAIRSDLSSVRVSVQDGARQLLRACDRLNQLEAALQHARQSAPADKEVDADA